MEPGIEVMALLDELDFSRAKNEIADLNEQSYDDYLCEQDCLSISLDWSGLASVQVSVRLDAFHSWRQSVGAPATIAGLNRFATVLWVSQQAAKGSPQGSPSREEGISLQALLRTLTGNV